MKQNGMQGNATIESNPSGVMQGSQYRGTSPTPPVPHTQFSGGSVHGLNDATKLEEHVLGEIHA